MAKQIFIHTRLSCTYLALARLSCMFLWQSRVKYDDEMSKQRTEENNNETMT